jgi:hypothetical protein
MSSEKNKTILCSYQRLKTNIYKQLQNAIYQRLKTNIYKQLQNVI